MGAAQSYEYRSDLHIRSMEKLHQEQDGRQIWRITLGASFEFVLLAYFAAIKAGPSSWLLVHVHQSGRNPAIVIVIGHPCQAH